MAYETGTATDHTDLFNKLVAFLTTNADLITAGEEWSQDWTAPVGAPNESAVVLTGVVGSGDPPKVAMQLVEDAANSVYEIQLAGVTNILSGADEITGHANVSPIVRIFADPNPMTYWFIGSGRRFIIAVKISTVYSTGYFGLFLPYALPTTYQYPMYIGGAAGLGSNQIDDWRSASDSHNSLALPGAVDGPSSQYRPPSASVLSPSAQWEKVVVPPPGGSTSTADSSATLHPYYDLGNPLSVSTIRSRPQTALQYQVEAFGSDFATHAITIMRKSPASQAYGVLDGVICCQGRNNASENVITIGADNYLVLQDAFRTTENRYCAVIQG